MLRPGKPNITCLGKYSTVSLQLTFRGNKGILAWGEEMRYAILRAAQGGTILAQWQLYENGRRLDGDGCDGGSIKAGSLFYESRHRVSLRGGQHRAEVDGLVAVLRIGDDQP